MPVMEVTLLQDYFAQRVVNRWNYIASGTATAVSLSFALTYAMGFTNPPALPETGTDFWSRLRQTQSVEAKNLVVSVRDIHSDTDFFSNPLGQAPGLNAGQASAPFVSMGYYSSVTRRSVRPGQKRIVGIRDEDTTTGGLVLQAHRDRMTLFAQKMSEVLTYDDSGQVLTFSPAICSKEAYTTPSGKTAYRYYATAPEQIAHSAVSVIWTARGNVRSQTTRQYGRGV